MKTEVSLLTKPVNMLTLSLVETGDDENLPNFLVTMAQEFRTNMGSLPIHLKFFPYDHNTLEYWRNLNILNLCLISMNSLLMVRYYNRYHNGSTICWISSFVNFKDGVDFAMLLTLWASLSATTQ